MFQVSWVTVWRWANEMGMPSRRVGGLSDSKRRKFRNGRRNRGLGLDLDRPATIRT
jgi:hypothetical protein